MRHPARAAVVDLGGAAAAFGQHGDIVEEGVDQFRQVADLGEPVIHLNVDVDVVVGAPRRFIVLAPDALQIRREFSARAGYQQIAAEIEIQLGQPRIVFGLGDPAVGRNIGSAPRIGQREAAAPEHRFEIRAVLAEDRIPSGGDGSLDAFPADGERVKIGLIGRGGGDVDRHAAFRAHGADDQRIGERELAGDDDGIPLGRDLGVFAFVTESRSFSPPVTRMTAVL